MKCVDCDKPISRDDSYRYDSLGPHHLPTVTCVSCVETVELATGGIIRAAVLALEKEGEEAILPLPDGYSASPPTERQAIIDEARQIVSVDRNSSYGEPEANHARIAALWSTYLEHDITPRQAALCMVLVKVAREIHAPKRDNLVDICGYAAVAGEL